MTAIHASPAANGNRVTIALMLLGAMAAVAILAPWIAPYDPVAQLDIVALKNRAPSLHHLLGTDAYSRDLLSRALYGARTSLSIAAFATALAIVMAVVWGGLAASLGQTRGILMMSLVDVQRSIPRILLLLAAVVIFDSLSVMGVSLLLGVTAWTGVSRLMYTLVREQGAYAYVEAARALGASRWRLLVHHIAPCVRAPLFAAGVLLLADLLAMESALSFLGIGVRAPAASWGSMVHDAVPYLRSAWWLTAVPCLLLVSTVVSAARLADALSDPLTHRVAGAAHELGGSSRHF